MKKVKNWLNAHEFPTEGEINNMPSLTVPDQSLSIKEILDRFTKGLPTGGQRVPVYDEDDDMPDFRTLDLAERQEMSENFRAELEQLRSTQAKRKASYEAKRQESLPAKQEVPDVAPGPPKSTNIT